MQQPKLYEPKAFPMQLDPANRPAFMAVGSAVAYSAGAAAMAQVTRRRK